MPTYNGHHCWNCWNVSLWIANEEPLYREAVAARRGTKTLRDATTRLLAGLPARTPDGARYTRRAVYAALAGLE